MKEIEREIEVIQNMIRLLNECRNIALTNKNILEVKACDKDIKLCKEHLKRLWEKREMEMKDYLLAGFFCSRCFNIIDGQISGIVRECDNCKRLTVVRKRKNKEKEKA